MNRRQIEARIFELFGRSTTLRHYPEALTAAQRTKNLDRCKEIRFRTHHLTTEIDHLQRNECWKLLLEAARFAVDVDGDEPSWTQLKAALEQAEILQRMLDERRHLKDEAETLRGSNSRWEVHRRDSLGVYVTANGDELFDIEQWLKTRTTDGAAAQ